MRLYSAGFIYGVFTNINIGFCILSANVVTIYCYSVKVYYNLLNIKDFSKWYNELIM